MSEVLIPTLTVFRHTMILLLTPLQLFKTLSDDTRLSIVLLLREMGELCVCDIGAALDAPQPKISRHLGMLRGCFGIGRKASGCITGFRPRCPPGPRG